jgi:hypothetical protein
MKHRFLLHSMSHMTLAIDITHEGLLSGASGLEEQDKVPILRFGSWAAAASYLISMGADKHLLEQAAVLLERTGTASITILQ